jgi:hypothetical protein
MTTHDATFLLKEPVRETRQRQVLSCATTDTVDLYNDGETGAGLHYAGRSCE